MNSIVKQHDASKTLLSVSDSAKTHVLRHINNNPSCQGVRLYLQESGCSGYAYMLEYVSQPQADDQEFIIDDGIKIFIAHKDLPRLKGTHIDYVRVGLNQQLQFTNPNETAVCGCGESFKFD